MADFASRVLLIANIILLSESEAALDVHYYHQTCPQAEKLILDRVRNASIHDPKVPARILRMFLHDCFIRQLKSEAATMVAKIELLESSKRKLLGQSISSCSVEELQDIIYQIEKSLRIIRERKAQLFSEEIEQLRGKERLLLEENARLHEQATAPQRETVTFFSSLSSSSTSDVETQLFIGLPEMSYK